MSTLLVIRLYCLLVFILGVAESPHYFPWLLLLLHEGTSRIQNRRPMDERVPRILKAAMLLVVGKTSRRGVLLVAHC